MPFTRSWDSSCPHVWESWEADGTRWVIQDLAPEDDEEALQIMLQHLVPDEVMCVVSGVLEDPVSMASLADFWRGLIAQRLSLACYAETQAGRALVALNCCVVECAGEKNDSHKIEGEACLNVFNTLGYVTGLVDVYKLLEVDKVLYGMGLAVKREYRGARLGSKVLAARKPMCEKLGLKATSTVFTGVASQKSATRAGFTTKAEATFSDLADAGLKYPREERVLKLMVKKY